jgi:hypothetical protein
MLRKQIEDKSKTVQIQRMEKARSIQDMEMERHLYNEKQY